MNGGRPTLEDKEQKKRIIDLFKIIVGEVNDEKRAENTDKRE